MSRFGPCVWEMRPGSAGLARETLLLLPHAGGSAQSYGAWATWLPDHLRVLAAQYPARASRSHEPAAVDLHHLVDELVDALDGLDGRLYVFGHSMGSYVGFEFCWKRQLSGRPPAVFFASGAVPPHRHRPDAEPGAEITDEELLKLLDSSSGIPESIRDYPEVMERALHTLRADVTLFNSYSYGARRRTLHIPIVSLGGDNDGLVPTAELDRWRELGAKEFSTHLISGEHFYYLDDMATFSATMSKYLARVHDEQKE